MTFEIVSASGLPFDAQWEIFNRAFAGYLASLASRGHETAEANAYRIDNACVVTAPPKQSPTRIFGLLGREGAALRNLLGAVIAKFTECEFFARQVLPENFAEIFAVLGFVREPLNQILMRHDLR